MNRRLTGRAVRLAGAALSAAALLGAVLDAPPASAASTGLIWTMRWSAPTTSQGPNRFAGPPVLSGTAAPAIGRPDRIDATVAAPSGLPAGCGAFPRAVPADVQGSGFTLRPDLACNGTYTVTVVARVGTGMLTASSPALTAPVIVADAGGPVGAVTGAVADGRVTVSWGRDGDPDVIGYRVRRNGSPVAEVPASQRTATDTVPSPGTYRYDVVTLRWGGDGPGSAAIASPPSNVFVAEASDPAPNASSGTSSPSGGSSSGGPTASGASGTGGTGGAGAASGPTGSTSNGSGLGAAALPGRPAPGGRSSTTSGSRTTSSAGGRGGSSPGRSTTGTTLDDGFAERLPYAARTRTEAVAQPGRPATKAVSRIVRIPHGPGLVMPFLLVGLLLGGSFALRRVLRRAGAAAESA